MAMVKDMSQRLSSLTSVTLLSPKVTDVRNSSSPSRCSMTKSSWDLEAIGLGFGGLVMPSAKPIQSSTVVESQELRSFAFDLDLL
jgi:hypothetical protein